MYGSFLFRVNGTVVVFLKLMLNSMDLHHWPIIRRHFCITSYVPSYLPLAYPVQYMPRSVSLFSNWSTIMNISDIPWRCATSGSDDVILLTTFVSAWILANSYRGGYTSVCLLCMNYSLG